MQRLHGGAEDEHDWQAIAARAESPPAFRLDGTGNRFRCTEAMARAEQALREGQLGVILVAGGQGTRLGFPHPKGMFPIGPLSQRTLFQMHVEQLRAVARRYATRIPLYLMTSPATHDETVAFFEQNARFGLGDDLRIFCQGTMPAVDAESGRLLLAARDEVFLSPDGHGGTLAASTGAAAWMTCGSAAYSNYIIFKLTIRWFRSATVNLSATICWQVPR